MTGDLSLSPYARRVIPDFERTAIRQRVPAGWSLDVSCQWPSTLNVYLRHGSELVAERHGAYPAAIDDALALVTA